MITTNEELREAYNIFSDSWKFFKKFASAQQVDDECWAELVSESELVAQRHQNNRLCKDLILAGVAELERKIKETAPEN